MKEGVVFFSKVLLFLILLLLVDNMLGLFFNTLLQKQSDGRYYKIAYTLDHANEEIFILGSSGAETNCNPKIITKNTGLSCWNASRGGQGLLYFLAVEQEILNRYSPKLLIIEIGASDLEREIDYEKPAFLRPFAKNHTSINSLLCQKDYFEKYKLLSNVYNFNSVIFYLIRPFIIKNKDGKTSDSGWKPKFGTISSPLINKNTIFPSKKTNNLNKESIILLNKIIDLAYKKKCKISFLISPYYFHTNTNSPSLTYIKALCQEKKLVVFDFLNDAILTEKPKYFYDLSHLNDVGANIFSKKLAERIELDICSKARTSSLKKANN